MELMEKVINNFWKEITIEILKKLIERMSKNYSSVISA